METDFFPSPLPCVENANNLDFWQSIGIASMIFSCHENCSGTILSDCFAHISHAIEHKRAVILFNNEGRPTALATYRTYDDLEESEEVLKDKVNQRDIVFDYIISPFSSPINIYRFLKKYLKELLDDEYENAYLQDSSNGNLRHIW